MCGLLPDGIKIYAPGPDKGPRKVGRPGTALSHSSVHTSPFSFAPARLVAPVDFALSLLAGYHDK